MDSNTAGSPAPALRTLTRGQVGLRRAQARALDRDFPAYHVWLSENGRWFVATRGGRTEFADDARDMRKFLAGGKVPRTVP